LDVCCGTGGLALVYDEMGIVATGIDIDPRVIEVAEKRRAESGSSKASFQTANALAARNGIKLASLQYHFKTKESLIDAVLDQILRDYEKRFNEGSPELCALLGPEQLLNFTIDFALKDTQRADSSNFFFQLWAMSCHDVSAARIQEQIYALYRKTFSELIKMLNPSLPAAERNIRSILIISMLDGLMLFISEGKSQRKHVSKIARQLKQEAWRIATDP